MKMTALKFDSFLRVDGVRGAFHVRGSITLPLMQQVSSESETMIQRMRRYQSALTQEKTRAARETRSQRERADMIAPGSSQRPASCIHSCLQPRDALYIKPSI